MVMSNIDNYSAIPRNAIIACSFSCFAQQNKMCCPASKQLNPFSVNIQSAQKACNFAVFKCHLGCFSSSLGK